MNKKLEQKLLITAEKRLKVINPPSGFASIADKSTRLADVLLIFVKNKEDISAACTKIVTDLTPGGILWFAYPKKSSGVKTDITRDIGWESLTKMKLLPVTQVAIDEMWSALRFKPVDQIAKLTRQTVATSAGQKKERKLELPKELTQLLAGNKKAAAFFQALSFTNRKEYVVWITSAKRPETLQKRLVATLEKLVDGKRNPSEK